MWREELPTFLLCEAANFCRRFRSPPAKKARLGPTAVRSPGNCDHFCSLAVNPGLKVMADIQSEVKNRAPCFVVTYRVVRVGFIDVNRVEKLPLNRKI